MQIHLDTSSASLDELTALIALLASLGGRLPDTLTVTAGSLSISGNAEDVRALADDAERAAPPPPATPADAAEALLQHAAATRTAPPPPGIGAPHPLALDPDGIPWDDRIHASTKSTNADGRWTKKRKVDEVLYGKVFAELQELYGPNDGTGTTNEAAGPNGSDTAATPAPPPPASDGPIASAAPPPPPPVESPKDQPAASAPTAPPPPASTAVESATGAGRFATFPDFVGAVNLLKAPSGKSYTYVELAGFSEMFGAPAFKDMKDKPEAWEDFYATAGGQ